MAGSEVSFTTEHATPLRSILAGIRKHPERSEQTPNPKIISFCEQTFGGQSMSHDLIDHRGLSDHSPGTGILIETPVPIDGKRITGHISGDVSVEEWE